MGMLSVMVTPELTPAAFLASTSNWNSWQLTPISLTSRNVLLVVSFIIDLKSHLPCLVLRHKLHLINHLLPEMLVIMMM